MSEQPAPTREEIERKEALSVLPCPAARSVQAGARVQACAGLSLAGG